jgi:hypothetical protein
LLRGQAHVACGFFSDAQRRFERLAQWLFSALCATYSVEAYVLLGDRRQAADAATSAARFFKAAGCTLDTLGSVARLQDLLLGEATTKGVARDVRELAGRHGGWLPGNF